MNAIVFDKWISHFIISIQVHGENLALINQQLLILDGHNLHVIIDVMHKTRKARLELTILPSHTNHALQPFDVACFKPLKLHFKLAKTSRLWLARKRVLARNI
jgi:hypothetical protein